MNAKAATWCAVAVCVALAVANLIVRESWPARLIASAGFLIAAALLYYAFLRRGSREW
jgi:hypothetical protein